MSNRQAACLHRVVLTLDDPHFLVILSLLLFQRRVTVVSCGRSLYDAVRQTGVRPWHQALGIA